MNSPVAPIKKSDSISSQEESLSKVAKELGEVLSNTYILYLKTQNFHWNVEGHRFVGIHTLTEEQYQDMVGAIDLIAERMRALGYYAPGSFRDFTKISQIEEAPEMPMSDQVMLETLEKDHMLLVEKLKKAIETAEQEHDTTTSDLLSSRREFHEKSAWMIRSLNK